MLNDLMRWALPFGMLSFADDNTGGDGGDKGDKGNEGDKGGETISKADHEKVVADFEKAKTDLEDMRMEVLTPEYLDYLNTDKKGKGEEDKGEKKEEKEEDLSKLSPKEILALAEKKADEKIAKFQEGAKGERSEATRLEVAAFSRTHTDYKTYRPIMYGLSLDPKHANLSLQELYNLSKEHVKGIHTETTDAEKEKQRKASSEKPGGASESFEEDRKLSTTDATKAAADEVKASLGDIPAA